VKEVCFIQCALQTLKLNIFACWSLLTYLFLFCFLIVL